MSETSYCLTMILAPTLEEQVLDLLLTAPETSAFTSTSVFGHGANPGDLNTAEQVLGRTRQVQVQLILSRQDADALLARLRQQLPGIGIPFWLSPVLERGMI
ncbi:DUF3240 family protein [Thermithiobacillus plumbiphilus]|uniref:DUF3240 family protein n=1 Tax=Thermithiobacillus plumbiphilus TaxID=1729899 RepID=A0ABU9D699_9PROT